MTVIRPNSISGITSITAQANDINFFRSDGTLAALQINGINFNNTSGISTLAALNVTGNVSIAGTLTYEDVTNVDSIGIITARDGIDCNGDLDVAGIATLGSGASGYAELFYQGTKRFETINYGAFISGSIVTTHDVKVGSYNGKLIAGTSNEFTIQHDNTNTIIDNTVGILDIKSQQVAISTHLSVGGNIGIGTDAPENNFHMKTGSATMKLTSTDATTSARLILESEDDSYGGVHFGDPSDEDAGRIRYYHGGSDPNHMQFSTAATERLRIGSDGLLTVSATGTSSGIRLIDSSNSGGAPNLEIIGKRSDGNVNTAFSSNIFLGSNRTDQKVTNNKFLGTINFGGNHTNGTEGNISYAAAIAARASGDFNSKTDMPTDLIFTTGTSGTNRDGEAAGQSNVGTERMRISSTGAVTKPFQPCASVYECTGPSGNNITSDSQNGDPLHFNHVDINQGGMQISNNNARIEVPVNGIYLVTMMISGSVVTVDQNDGIEFNLLRNGTEYPASNSRAEPVFNFGSYKSSSPSGESEFFCTNMLYVQCTSGDYLELAVSNINNSDGTINRGNFGVMLMG